MDSFLQNIQADYMWSLQIIVQKYSKFIGMINFVDLEQNDFIVMHNWIIVPPQSVALSNGVPQVQPFWR